MQVDPNNLDFGSPPPGPHRRLVNQTIEQLIQSIVNLPAQKAMDKFWHIWATHGTQTALTVMQAWSQRNNQNLFVHIFSSNYVKDPKRAAWFYHHLAHRGQTVYAVEFQRKWQEWTGLQLLPYINEHAQKHGLNPLSRKVRSAHRWSVLNTFGALGALLVMIALVLVFGSFLLNRPITQLNPMAEQQLSWIQNNVSSLVRHPGCPDERPKSQLIFYQAPDGSLQLDPPPKHTQDGRTGIENADYIEIVNFHETPRNIGFLNWITNESHTPNEIITPEQKFLFVVDQLTSRTEVELDLFDEAAYRAHYAYHLEAAIREEIGCLVVPNENEWVRGNSDQLAREFQTLIAAIYQIPTNQTAPPPETAPLPTPVPEPQPAPVVNNDPLNYSRDVIPLPGDVDIKPLDLSAYLPAVGDSTPPIEEVPVPPPAADVSTPAEPTVRREVQVVLNDPFYDAILRDIAQACSTHYTDKVEQKVCINVFAVNMAQQVWQEVNVLPVSERPNKLNNIVTVAKGGIVNEINSQRAEMLSCTINLGILDWASVISGNASIWEHASQYQAFGFPGDLSLTIETNTGRICAYVQDSWHKLDTGLRWHTFPQDPYLPEWGSTIAFGVVTNQQPPADLHVQFAQVESVYLYPVVNNEKE